MTLPDNTIIVSGDLGIDRLLTNVYDAWDAGKDYAIIWHLDDCPGPMKADTSCGCPKMVFTAGPVPAEGLTEI